MFSATQVLFYGFLGFATARFVVSSGGSSDQQRLTISLGRLAERLRRHRALRATVAGFLGYAVWRGLAAAVGPAPGFLPLPPGG